LKNRRSVPASERHLWALGPPKPPKPEPAPEPELEPVELLGGQCALDCHSSCFGWWPVGVVEMHGSGTRARPAKCRCWCHQPGGGA
jgi:hypothetical protein